MRARSRTSGWRWCLLLLASKKLSVFKFALKNGSTTVGSSALDDAGNAADNGQKIVRARVRLEVTVSKVVDPLVPMATFDVISGPESGGSRGPSARGGGSQSGRGVRVNSMVGATAPVNRGPGGAPQGQTVNLSAIVSNTGNTGSGSKTGSK